ncbi:hypothetical protein [Oceanicoccus sp. KOV_DT_Chl]|uniref:hypothetical protein n=1 Tax=Oceanicoccus sp. KOV_DT_Chl TaxID=1904639 RepID=UPI0011AF68F2|nr:hypothetical protein [Oceanicoccus sp. KOV_DT_Chl]
MVTSANGEIPVEEAVSCASCHLPRIKKEDSGTDIVINNTINSDSVAGINSGAIFDKDNIFRVEHNQNFNLRPNEKMIRSTCMHCHSLEFSIDSLADQKLIKNNFNGKPGVHIPSMDWALEREKK